MQSKKTISLAVLFGCTVMLAGCGKSPEKQASLAETNPTNGQYQQTQQSAAQTYQASPSGRYQQNSQQQAGANGIYPRNSLSAPANQTYYFAFDSSQLFPDEVKAMHVQARYLATHPYAQIRLEGNTDNRGSREYNVALGWRRDQAILHYLEQQGVSPKQVQMVSYGKERPAVLGDNRRAWALNRRVELKYKAY